MKKEYKNNDITVVWEPEICIHSGICANGLSSVFKPRERPWIDMNAASTKHIEAQVNACPSGALSYYKNTTEDLSKPSNDHFITGIKVTENGPLLVNGPIALETPEGLKTVEKKLVALCRCGVSENKPFCDGSHKSVDFKG